MKRFLILIMSLIIIANLSACNSINEATNKFQYQGEKPSNDVAQSSDSSDKKEGSIKQSYSPTDKVPDKSQYSFYGDWEVTKCLAFPTVSEYNNDTVKAFLGVKIKYSADMAVSSSGTCNNPIYRISTITKEDFRDSYKGSLNDMGVIQDSIVRVQVYPSEDSKLGWEGIGNTIFVKDDNTLILWNGVFLEMKRTKQEITSQGTDDLKMNAVENLTYLNKDQKFSFTFPEPWKGKYVIEKGTTKENEKRVYIYHKFNNQKALLFAIYTLTEKEYSGDGSKIIGLNTKEFEWGSELKHRDGIVFLAGGYNKSPYNDVKTEDLKTAIDEFNKLKKDIYTIEESFKFTN